MEELSQSVVHDVLAVMETQTACDDQAGALGSIVQEKLAVRACTPGGENMEPPMVLAAVQGKVPSPEPKSSSPSQLRFSQAGHRRRKNPK